MAEIMHLCGLNYALLLDQFAVLSECHATGQNAMVVFILNVYFSAQVGLPIKCAMRVTNFITKSDIVASSVSNYIRMPCLRSNTPPVDKVS